MAPKKPHFPAKAKSCIVLFMYGGVSQVDTFDPKTQLTKHHGMPIPTLDSDPLLKVRNPGKLLASSRKFAKHGAAGTIISDLYPHLAGRLDDIAVIRSMYTDSFAHGSGLLQMNTGYLRQGLPSLGSWVTYGLGTVNRNLPGYVVLLDHRGGPISGPPNWGSGFMPAAYQGTLFRTSGDPILNLLPPDGTSAAQQRHQLDLLAKLGQPQFGGDNTELAARIASYELAFRMQSSLRRRPLIFRAKRRKRRSCTDSTIHAPSDLAVAVSWRGGSSSAACGSCRSTQAAATTTKTGTHTAT